MCAADHRVAGHARLPPAGRRRGRQRAAGVLRGRRQDRRLRGRHPQRRHRPAGEPVLPLPQRTRSGRAAAGRAPTRSAISSWRRSCRSSSGTRSRTMNCCSSAIDGKLKDPAVLDRQVKRLLADPRSETLAANFVHQWLDMKRLDEIVPDSTVFPYASGRSDPRDDFRTELTLFADSIFREDRSVVDLLRATHTYLNERVALHYGITDVKGDRFRRVELAAVGALGPARQGRRADGGGLPEPHVAGAARRVRAQAHPGRAAGEAAGRGADAGREGHRHDQGAHRPRDDRQASRQPDLCVLSRGHGSARAWRSRTSMRPACGGSAIATPAWRSTPPGCCPTARPSPVRTTCARRCCAVPGSSRRRSPKGLLTYATGRKLEHYDMPTVRRIVRGAAAGDYRFSSLVQAVVRSEQFRMRRVPARRDGRRAIVPGKLTETIDMLVQEAHLAAHGVEGCWRQRSRCRCWMR